MSSAFLPFSVILLCTIHTIIHILPHQEGCMYIFGGVKDLNENIRTARITKVWLGVAKLRDMCWEALCHYCPNLPSQPPSALLAMGIPPYIVEALQHQTPAYG